MRSPLAPAYLVHLLGGTAALLGVLVLSGWTLDISWLKSILPGSVPLKANTALGLSLSGAVLLCLADTASVRHRGVAEAAPSSLRRWALPP